MASKPMPEAADEVIERLALELRAQALGEVQFMAQVGIPEPLGQVLAVQALQRAAMMMEAKA